MRALRLLPRGLVVGAAALLLAGLAGARPVHAQTTSTGNLVVLTDFVLGAPTPGPDVPACVQLSRYPQGSKIVVRTRVIDGSTGQALSDSDLSSVQVAFDGNPAVDETYGGHPGGPAPKTDYFWSGAWTIPSDYPTGNVDVTVTATAQDGRTATWQPFNVAASGLMVTPSTPAAS